MNLSIRVNFDKNGDYITDFNKFKFLLIGKLTVAEEKLWLMRFKLLILLDRTLTFGRMRKHFSINHRILEKKNIKDFDNIFSLNG